MLRGFGHGPKGRQSGAGRGIRGKKNGIGAGPGGYCICPVCGEKVHHQRGVPCYQVKCPKCGQPMV